VDDHGERITLELTPGEPIQGRVLDTAGAAYDFYGWLELSAAIDSARALPQRSEHSATWERRDA
jgi:hypothetical protein